ncbi:MAG: hypothetical protein GY698_13705 [Actinomycetia bacterium]|nr:hypothetical protein [Actinomycetes bacterium]
MGDFFVGLIIVLGVLAVLAIMAVVGAQMALNRHNRVVSGTRSAAPSSWLASPRPEAQLHRRLRAAGRRLELLAASESLVEVVGRLRSELIEVDTHLVTVSRRPASSRRQDRRELTKQVSEIEDLVRRVEERERSQAGSLNDLSDRLDMLEAADEELRGLGPG